MGLSWQGYCSRLSFPTPEELYNPGIKPTPPAPPALQVDSLLLNQWEALGIIYIRSVQFSCKVMRDSLRSHGLQHGRLPSASPTPKVYSNSCVLSRWCHPTISSSVIPFSSCFHSSRASGSFQMSQFFTSGGQSIAVSASTSVLPMNIQDWFPLGWTGWISFQSKGLSGVFSNTIV